MTRRRVVLLSLALAGSTAALAAPLASATVAPPRPCPVQPLVYQANGNIYVSVPDATGQHCRTTIEVPGSIKPPPTS